MIVIVTRDLAFSAALREQSAARGMPCVVVRAESSLASLPADSPVRLVLLDLELKDPDCFAVADRLRSLFPAALQLGWYSHVHTELPAVAAAHGIDRVLTRGAFVKSYAEIFALAQG